MSDKHQRQFGFDQELGQTLFDEANDEEFRRSTVLDFTDADCQFIESADGLVKPELVLQSGTPTALSRLHGGHGANGWSPVPAMGLSKSGKPVPGGN